MGTQSYCKLDWRRHLWYAQERRKSFPFHRRNSKHVLFFSIVQFKNIFQDSVQSTLVQPVAEFKELERWFKFKPGFGGFKPRLKFFKYISVCLSFDPSLIHYTSLYQGEWSLPVRSVSFTIHIHYILYVRPESPYNKQICSTLSV